MADIVLGTVRFGKADYGINNKRGPIPRSEVFEIIDTAMKSGINTLDTASIYGNSEEMIGEYIRSRNPAFNVITKYSSKNGNSVKSAFEDSLKKIGQERIYGYLVHDFKDYSARPGIWDSFRSLKDSGKVINIGFSLYYPDELKTLMDKKVKPDIIQVPFNILDQRFAEHFEEIKSADIEIHVRSVFLQGLLFKKPDELSGRFAPIRDKIGSLADISHKTGIPISAACINFAALNKHIDKIVLGVEGLKDLRDNLEALKYSGKVGKIYNDLAGLKEYNEQIILPVNWGK